MSGRGNGNRATTDDDDDDGSRFGSRLTWSAYTHTYTYTHIRWVSCGVPGQPT